MKHEINNIKEKYEIIKWKLHYYDAELLLVACVIAFVSVILFMEVLI
jgi:hypothetical protein